MVICYSVFPHLKRQKHAVKKLASYLKDGGKLAICHSQGRIKINDFHRHLTGAISKAYLPGLPVLQKYFQAAGLYTEVAVDNDNMFIISGIKSKYSF